MKLLPLFLTLLCLPVLLCLQAACSSAPGAGVSGGVLQADVERSVPVQRALDRAAEAAVFLNDRYLDRQWYYLPMKRMIGSGGDRKVLVAVLDTGVDALHEDLIGNVIDEVNFAAGSQTCFDEYQHGTHVVGIIAAHADNRLGIAGLSPSARILNVKVADDSGRVFPSDMARGITWAADRGAQVINVSLCVANGNGTLRQAVEYAWKKGALIVAAAGSCDAGTQMPACYPHVISAGALDVNLEIWHRSNQGDCVNAYAPGVDIYSTVPGNAYRYTSGTSMASACLSAAAAEFFSTAVDASGNGLVNDEVSERIRQVFAYSGTRD